MTDETLDLALKDWASVTVAPEVGPDEAEQVVRRLHQHRRRSVWIPIAVAAATMLFTVTGVAAAMYGGAIYLSQVRPMYMSMDPVLVSQNGQVTNHHGLETGPDGSALAEIDRARVGLAPNTHVVVLEQEGDELAYLFRQETGSVAYAIGQAGEPVQTTIHAGRAEMVTTRAVFGVTVHGDDVRVHVLEGEVDASHVRSTTHVILQPDQAVAFDRWKLVPPVFTAETAWIDELLKPDGTR